MKLAGKSGGGRDSKRIGGEKMAMSLRLFGQHKLVLMEGKYEYNVGWKRKDS